MNDGYCTEISFFNEKFPFEGTIRKSPQKEKIIDLVSRFQYLQKVNLRKSKLGKIPKFLSRELSYLDLSCNDLGEVPQWVLQLPNLKFLNLGVNGLSKLPKIDHLLLTTLKLHKNSLTHIPPLNPQLKSLNLYLNPLEMFPEFIPSLPCLEVFSLGVTRLRKLPSFSKLKKLRFLTMTVNEFRELPENFWELEILEYLALAKNKIQSLPEKIGQLRSLRALTVYENDLSTLPETFFDLNLLKLNLMGNSLQNYRERVEKKFSKLNFFKM